MKLVVRPSRVAGTVRASPSKSYTHRAILLAALSRGPCRVGRPLLSEDTEATVGGVEAFGARVERVPDGLRVTSDGLRVPGREIDARNSGTTLRLLTGIAALLDGRTVLTGDDSLRKRPMGPLLEALRPLGAACEALGPEGRPPVAVRGPLVGGTTSLPGSVSSQFLSSLLIACPLAKGDSHIHVVPPLLSEPYVGITVAMLRAFGVSVDQVGMDFDVSGGQSSRPTDFEVPGDFSSAAFPLAAAAVSGGDVTVTGLDPSSPQGDRRVLAFLESFGADVTTSGGGIRVGGGGLSGQTVDVGDTPDLFPVLSVVATQARGETRFVNGAHLRLKESDRIATTVAMLDAMGADATPTADGCVVRGPCRLRAASVDSHGDHRILMAAAVAALAADGPVEVTDPWCFRVSYPSFLDDLRSLGAAAEVVP